MMTRIMTRMTNMSSPEPSDGSHGLGAGARAAGVILWSSFLAGAFATMLCFAFLDPLSLAAGEPPPWWTTRLRVYAVGFFFFWAVCLVAAALTWFLTPRAAREP
jgi:hypothetical protein